jgi:hypothetical protein
MRIVVFDRAHLPRPREIARFKQGGNFITVTAANERAYSWWVSTCGRIADMSTPPRWPVDVEIGFFHPGDTGQIDAADSILRLTTGA